MCLVRVVCCVRLLLAHVGADEHIVALNVHHMATDGWSTSLLTDDIVLAYNALVAGESVQLGGESSIRYVDYAQWQRELLGDDEAVALSPSRVSAAADTGGAGAGASAAGWLACDIAHDAAAAMAR